METNSYVKKYYAVKHKDKNIIANSRSGGIFTALSDYILSKEGSVYGCAMDTVYSAIHIRATTPEERNRMRGSKYIQSRCNNCFKEIKNDLLNGKQVLFSGTSCQVAGLKSYLRKDYENLFCIGIACHGVTSQLVWEKYLKWIEQETKSKIINVNFRNKKKYGWRDHVESFDLENGKTVYSDIYRNLFLQDLMLRPSCYKCPYKEELLPGDITIADFWGIENAKPDFDDDKGVSLAILQTIKGEILFNLVKENLLCFETNHDICLQDALFKSSQVPQSRNNFWRDFNNNSFGFVASKYGFYTETTTIKLRIKRLKYIMRKTIKGK